ncbi:MAG: SGNH/GDSL hydrolase family protein [Oligoflexia bacterium]|nr:SGNH/GDSL hydrolase family protein [Oligoflexia bacterium]
MGSVGDSITAATFADHSANEPFLGPPDESGIRQPVDPSIPALVLSIENKGTYSWASGRRIASHFERLKNALEEQGLGNNIVIQNDAVPGEVAKGLVAQADNIARSMLSGEFEALTYVTFFIGNNDACTETDNEKMREHLRRAFAALADIRQAEKIRILVSGMPAIPDLNRPEIRRHRIPGSMTCEEVRREVFHSCGHLLNWNTESEYQERMAEVAAKNQVIEESAREAQARHRNLDIKFTNVLFHQKIPAEWLAVDCFHPNKDGQAEISRLLWNEQPWFK